MDKKEKVLVAGTGISGIGAARLLLEAKESVILYDGNQDLNGQKVLHNFKPDASVELLLGELKEAVIRNISYCVISPGIPLTAPFVRQLANHNIPIISEIELAYRYAKGKLAAITGTNGKTTTTALTGAILKSFYPDTHIVGNIGTPYTQEALRMGPDSVTVAEVSSFQLETIVDFKPKVSAILNITPDHLDRHKTMEAYIEIKESITKNQDAGGVCVLNYEDPVLRSFGESLDIPVLYFSSLRPLRNGIFLTGDEIRLSDGQGEIPIMNTRELQIIGRHNYENAMAAIAVSFSMGVPLDAIRTACRNFKGVEHRIEFVAEKKGVVYYNDSKGTNPDAAIKGITAMDRPTVLIAGGYDKHSEYEDWIRSFEGRVKKMILIGQTKEKIRKAAYGLGFTACEFAESLEEAVEKAAFLASSGDAVLLSPACASWGMFQNYEERGKVFKDCVNRL